MANPQLNIGNLDFDDIKGSLKEYLKNQDTFKDYNFEGSALSTILDVLSYNTLYYAFYSNMIANEMFLDSAQKLSSVISLAKPLGYTVPGSRSAKATVRVSAGGVNPIPKYHRFTGSDEGGRSFNFYTLQEYNLDNGVEEIDLYQGSKLFRNVEVTLNEDRTKVFIGRTDIDIESLTVEVVPPGETPCNNLSNCDNIWELSTVTNEQVNSESKVYFLERTDSGFFVVFGGNFSDGINSGAGRTIDENSTVLVSYITSNGELGNGVTRFATDYSTIDSAATPTFTTIFPSSGGAVDPNLDAVKFFAPKWFAAQDRVVTKNDAISVLSREFIPEDNPNADLRISVWGGEENNPPYYGRLFFSLLNEDPDADPNANGAEVEKARQILKDKCVVTVLPEAVQPELANIQFRINGTYDPAKTNNSLEVVNSKIVSALNEKFSGQRQFNKIIRENDILECANGIEGVNVEGNGILSLLTKEFPGSDGIRYFNTKNSILYNNTPVVPFRSIQSSPATGFGGIPNLQLVDEPMSIDSSGWAPLRLYGVTDGVYFPLVDGTTNRLVNAGRVNYGAGIIEIYAGMIVEGFTLQVRPNRISFEGVQQLVVQPSFQSNLEEIAAVGGMGQRISGGGQRQSTNTNFRRDLPEGPGVGPGVPGPFDPPFGAPPGWQPGDPFPQPEYTPPLYDPYSPPGPRSPFQPEIIPPGFEGPPGPRDLEPDGYPYWGLPYPDIDPADWYPGGAPELFPPQPYPGLVEPRSSPDSGQNPQDPPPIRYI